MTWGPLLAHQRDGRQARKPDVATANRLQQAIIEGILP